MWYVVAYLGIGLWTLTIPILDALVDVRREVKAHRIASVWKCGIGAFAVALAWPAVVPLLVFGCVYERLK